MRAAALLGILVTVGPSPVRGAGPLMVNGGGVALRWVADPVRYRPDRGRLGILDNAAATSFVASRFAVWEAVPTAAIAFASAGALPVDVRAANYTSWLGRCDGVSPIIFDHDGGITDDLLGIGARNAVLGFASPECGDALAGTITEAVAVLNGRFVDGVESARNPELGVTAFGAVFLHEFGHFFNLDHSQVNRAEAFDGDPANDAAIPTMFPFLVSATEAASLALDDVASVSALYPAPSFASATAMLRGRVLHSDGRGFQGAYVVARSLADPRHLAVGVASGARFAPGSPGGPPPETLRGEWEIAGLPPGPYTIEIEEIDARFTGGSSVGPLDPPAVLPAVPEFWNGAAEAASDPPDDPDARTAVVATAGALADGIDVVLNEAPAPNDPCTGAVMVPGIPFVDTQSAAAATSAPDDPLQSCTTDGPARNGASLWYVLTPAVAGRVVIETRGSNYDTVLTAYTGSCASLDELACSDDTDGSVQSRLDVDATAGVPLLVEVTAYRDTVPATLRLGIHNGCVPGSGACDDGDPCTAGDACTDGICIGPGATCDDGNACTADLCGLEGGCVHEPAAGRCDDGDACTLADACTASACVAGPRIDAPTLAASLDTPLPIACAAQPSKLRRTLVARFVRAGRQVARAAAGDGAARARAFGLARRVLTAIDRLAARLARRGAVGCAGAVASRVANARDQLECVASDLAAPAR